jgi:hypothetical protein
MDLSGVIIGLDGAQPFTVIRTTGSFGEGGFTLDTPTSIPMVGIISVASPRDVVHVPEGDRATGAMVFYSTQEVYITRVNPENGISDEIEWNDDTYHITTVSPYKDYGYFKAIGVRKIGD